MTRWDTKGLKLVFSLLLIFKINLAQYQKIICLVNLDLFYQYVPAGKLLEPLN